MNTLLMTEPYEDDETKKVTDTSTVMKTWESPGIMGTTWDEWADRFLDGLKGLGYIVDAKALAEYYGDKE